VVEEHRVGDVAGGEVPVAGANAERARGSRGEGGNGVARRHPGGFDRAAQGDVLGEGGSGERRRAREHCEAVPHGHVEGPEAVVAVGGPRRGHRVGHEGDAAGCGREDHRRDIRMHMESVEDQLEGDPVVFEGRDHRSRGAVVDARHGVEDVGEEARPAVERGPGELKVGLGVADGHGDAVLHEHVDRLERPVELGREGELAQGAAGGAEQLLDLDGKRVDQELGIVGPAPAGREKRPLEMRTEHERIGGGKIGDHAEALAQPRHRIGHEADHRAGGAMSPVRGESGSNLARIVVEGVPAAAVPVQVEEARHEPAAADVDALVGLRMPRAGAGRDDRVAAHERPEVVDLPVAVELARSMEEGRHSDPVSAVISARPVSTPLTAASIPKTMPTTGWPSMNQAPAAEPITKISTRLRPTTSSGKTAFGERNSAQTTAANSGVPIMNSTPGQGNGQAR
jgi:hypothetical protein